jgi:hypothetical protein
MSRRARGFALLPVVFALALLAVVIALLLERGGVEHGIADNRQRADALGYVAEAGYAHAKALLARQGACAGLPAVPSTPLGGATYSAALTAGTAVPSSTYSFVTVADAWLESASTAAAHGPEKDLKVKNKSGDHHRSVLLFDLSGLPSGADIASAQLQLFVKTTDSSGNPVQVYRATAAWNEATVTWGNAGGSYDGAWVQAQFQPAAAGASSVDVTRLVRLWTTGGVPNFGVYLVATSNDVESVYASREEGDSTRVPRLVVTTRPRVRIAVNARGTAADGVERTVSASADGPANAALVLDYFNGGYAGSNGTRGWSGDWQEIGENNGPGAGAVRVVSDSRCAYGSCLKFDSGLLLSSIGIARSLNLQGATNAVLRVDSRRDGGNWTLQVSGNGGGSWQTLKNAGSTDDSQQVRDAFDVSAYATSNMVVKLSSSSLLTLGVHDTYFDNVEIEATCAP